MVDNSFFQEQKEQSLVKSTIVTKYFNAWAKIIISTQKRYSNRIQKIAYIDLFSGPGRYEDGTLSTPVKILTTAIENRDLCDRLITVFNDKDDENINSLKKTILEIPGIESLKYEPEFHNEEVDEELAKMFEKMRLIPTLLFIDPWGYKGLSLRLINSVLKNWGCDVIFFFNYNRINMAINNPNPKVQKIIKSIFGDEQLFSLKLELLKYKNSKERESLIIDNLRQTIQGSCKAYVNDYKFKNEKKKRTSHNLIFASKAKRGYDIMKDIMAKVSTNHIEGVPSFGYNPSDHLPKQLPLFTPPNPLEKLKADLLNKFKGRTIKMVDIYNEHNVDTPFILTNYKKVLRELYEEDIIEAIHPNGNPPRKGTFGDNIIVTFPQ